MHLYFFVVITTYFTNEYSYRVVSLLLNMRPYRGVKCDTEQQEIKVIYVDTDIFIGEKQKNISCFPVDFLI